jgi:hypothetical protein
MPYVDVGKRNNAATWRGDRWATVDYCKVNLPRICETFGGDLTRVLICGGNANAVREDYLIHHLDLADFTFLDVRVSEIFDIPEGIYLHPHTDLWMHRASPYRDRARDWLNQHSEVRRSEDQELLPGRLPSQSNIRPLPGPSGAGGGGPR